MPLPRVFRRIAYRALLIRWKLFSPVVLGARAIVVHEGRVLLVRMHYADGWHLPGGGVNRGESFDRAARRELREECGLEAEDWTLFGLYVGGAGEGQRGRRDVVAVYAARSSSIELRIDPREIAEAKFFAPDEIPADASPGTSRRLAEWLGRRAISGRW